MKYTLRSLSDLEKAQKKVESRLHATEQEMSYDVEDIREAFSLRNVFSTAFDALSTGAGLLSRVLPVDRLLLRLVRRLRKRSK